MKQTRIQFDPEHPKEIELKLLEYCRANGWAGYDPYDALNSRVYRALPLLNVKPARLMLTQLVKRSPVNVRPLLLVPKSPSSKGIALFLSSIVSLFKSGVITDKHEIRTLGDMLLSLRSPSQRYSCWGYNFDWQTRHELVPQGSPNIICSTFAANALLDAYEQAPDPSWLDAAISAAQFIIDVLYRRDGSSAACFSYTPLRTSEVHNANLLGAAFLCRIGQLSGQTKFLAPGLDAARYSVSKQRGDGCWPYGEARHQEWIDNFHTGFNLVALKRVGNYGETAEFNTAISQGLEFYKTHFFLNDGGPKYFHDKAYPLDIHSAAQSVITLVELKDLSRGNFELARRVLDWAIGNMWDSRGFFYFQRHPHYTVRTPFMRWSQAWMLLAIATLLEESSILSKGETLSSMN